MTDWLVALVAMFSVTFGGVVMTLALASWVKDKRKGKR